MVREEEVEMNPLENAVYAMQSKNEELHLRIREAELVGDREAPQSFTMMINGTVLLAAPRHAHCPCGSAGGTDGTGGAQGLWTRP